MFIVDRDIILDFCVFFFLVVSSSATDCLERLVSKMTYNASSGMLNPATTCNSHGFMSELKHAN